MRSTVETDTSLVIILQQVLANELLENTKLDQLEFEDDVDMNDAKTLAYSAPTDDLKVAEEIKNGRLARYNNLKSYF